MQKVFASVCSICCRVHFTAEHTVVQRQKTAIRTENGKKTKTKNISKHVKEKNVAKNERDVPLIWTVYAESLWIWQIARVKRSSV